jgi:SpoVK/Ycf46/Vps4 family AAA+-type ATPase
MLLEDYYWSFLPRFRDAKFLNYNDFLNALNSGKIQKILFLENEMKFFGILSDHSLVYHNVMQEELSKQILENISNQGTEAKHLNNTFSNPIKLWFTIFMICFSCVLIYIAYDVIFSVKHNKKRKEREFQMKEEMHEIQKKQYEMKAEEDKNILKKILGLTEGQPKENGQNHLRLYDKSQKLDDFVFADELTKKTIENLIDSYKTSDDETNQIIKKVLKKTSKTEAWNSSTFLYGPPGTGKTLLGHVIANEIGAEFRYVNSTFFISKYINNGPTRINDFFESIFKEIKNLQNDQKFVLFIDEADITFAQRKDSTNNSDAQGNQVTTTFLTKLEECQKTYGDRLILIFATNHLNHLDEAIVSRINQKIELPALQKDQKIELFKKKFSALKENIENFDTILGEIYNQNSDWFDAIDGRMMNNLSSAIENFLNQEIEREIEKKQNDEPFKTIFDNIKEFKENIEKTNQEKKQIEKNIKDCIDRKEKYPETLPEKVSILEKMNRIQKNNEEEMQKINEEKEKMKTQDKTIKSLESEIKGEEGKLALEIQGIKNQIKITKDEILEVLNPIIKNDKNFQEERKKKNENSTKIDLNILSNNTEPSKNKNNGQQQNV